ncbi:hypothetical protein C8R43DRAFT_558932 [Mycena crocata]|nr:hypothetical protein C8R43DRAFT_558932 [Mycena crocata]
MSTPAIVLNSDLTSELVEFWGFKYKEAKQQLEEVKQQLEDFKKRKAGQEDGAQTYDELKRLVQQLQADAADTARRLEANDRFLQNVIASSRNEQRLAQEKLDARTAEKTELLVQLARADTERVALYHQIQASYIQSVSLAAEADRQRMAVIVEQYSPTASFFPDSFTPTSVTFNSAKQLVGALPRDSDSYPWQLYFLPRPPNSIPLHVSSACQSGYWFYPFNLSPMDSAFELIVEVDLNKWLYYGRYTTRLFPGYEMKLSEWTTLDEQAKSIFCTRIASQKLPVGQTASHALQMDVRQRYDSGQWSVPCYTLQCVGFDMALYDALTATSAKLRCDANLSNSSVVAIGGKRRRTETPSCCEPGDDGLTKKPRHSETPDRVNALDLIDIRIKGE